MLFLLALDVLRRRDTARRRTFEYHVCQLEMCAEFNVFLDQYACSCEDLSCIETVLQALVCVLQNVSPCAVFKMGLSSFVCNPFTH